MSVASYNQQFLGFLRLTEAEEIDWVDPQLLESVSSELKNWIGLPFVQWVNHAFLQVSDLAISEEESPATKVLTAGKPKEEPEFIFRWISAGGKHWVQVCRIAPLVSSAQHSRVSKVYGETDEVCLQHFWNQLMSWMVPGFIHDANNQLSALTSLAQCLAGAVDDGAAWDDEQKEDLDSLLQCSKETTELFRFLSKIYKWNTSHSNHHDLRDLLADTAHLIDVALPGSFTIQADCGNKEMHVFLNPLHLAQLLLGQVSQWYPDRNQRPQGTMRLSVLPSAEMLEDFGRSVGERPSKPCWMVQLHLDDSLAQKRTTNGETEFHSRIQPLLLKKLQGAFLTHQLEPRWVLELPQAPAEVS